MIILIKEAGMKPVEVTLQPTESANPLNVSPIDALRALMEFYESGAAADEEESEIDLMIQLSGMVQNHMQSDE
jgi:hypothetical protein